MKKKILWLVVSCLTVAALLLAACAPAVTEEPVTEQPVTPVTKEPVTKEPVTKEPVTKEPVAAPEGTEMVRDVNGKLVPKPQYGGMYTMMRTRAPTYWDGARRQWPDLMYDSLLQWDWARGPAGTGEWKGLYREVITPHELIVGRLAESWERPDDTTLLFKIRQGVHFQEESVMKGREMDAYDIEYSLRRSWTIPGSYNTLNYAASTHYPGGSVEEGIKALDQWTLQIKSQAGMLGSVFEMAAFRWGYVVGPEIEDYDMNDWRNAGGTGPFILVDYVSGSAETYKKNPNYWMKDPLHPQNQLPYINGIKRLLLEDTSTRLAALRTGRLDILGQTGVPEGAVEWGDAVQIKKSNPELQYIDSEPDRVQALYMRNDRPEQPWYDINVRRALAMAINRQEIVDDYYGGQASLFAWPAIESRPELPDIWIPLEEYPEVVQKLFGYYPEEAKQMLVNAGYPNGFTAEVLTSVVDDVDLLALIADYLKKNLNVTLDIQVKESAVFTSIYESMEQKEMIFKTLNQNVTKMVNVRIARPSVNHSAITDPYPESVYEETIALYWDPVARSKAHKEAFPYMLEQAWFIQLPNPHTTEFWQPWVHNYAGSRYVGYVTEDYQTHIWLDLDLKEKLTGRR